MNLQLKPHRIGNIFLREIEVTDAYDYFQIGKDAETVQFLNWGPFKRVKEASWVIENIFLRRPLEGLPIGYAILMDSKMIGEIDFHTINEKENSIEIGYVLHKDYWGKGIMSRCCRYMVHLAFEMGYDKVVLGSLIENFRSIRLIEALGFQYEEERMEAVDENDYRLARYYAKYRNEVFL